MTLRAPKADSTDVVALAASAPPQLLMAALWGTVGCANLLLLSLGPSSLTEMLKVFGTTAGGLALSLLLSAAIVHQISVSDRHRAAILISFSIAGGAALWAVDAALREQDFLVLT